MFVFKYSRKNILPCRSASSKIIPETTKPRNVRNKFRFLSGDFSINVFNASVDCESFFLNSRNGCACATHSIRPSVLSTGRT